jgi:hypothetical protein
LRNPASTAAGLSHSRQRNSAHNVTFTKNTFTGTGHKAIALGLDATGATVADDNLLGPGYERLVGFDDESARTGYRGPTQ